jgi:predicted signal transduction protein with EAL and GGDEF domain
VLLAAPAGREAAGALAARLVDLLSRPYVAEGQVALVGASVGVALAPADAAEPDALIARADLALYAAKAAGRGGFRFFEPAMQARADGRRRLEQELRAALPLGQLELHYQPQVELAGGNRLTGFEALVRWRHPERGLVAPDLFIPLAAEVGLISAVGEWVVRTACADAARWPGGLRVAVNVTPAELETGRLLPTVAAALRETGLHPHRLEVELTESALHHPTEEAIAQLHGLRMLGVQVSLDDFGTGFSSLMQLRSFPFDRIKIDRSFAEDAAVVRAVRGLGNALGMRTTAEGVETPAQLESMRDGGCTDAQGYLLGRPVPAGEVAGVIARWTRPGGPRPLVGAAAA